MSIPKISVLVPIFNVEKYLEECLDSIVNQTLLDIEIICINDGSTDSSLKIVKKYAKTDDRIVIIDKKNSGYGDSMNHGLKKATGEYIGIVESDDWIELDAFEKMYSMAKDNSVDIVKSNFYNYFTDPKKVNITGTITRLVHPDETGRVINPSKAHHIFYQRPAIWSAIYRRAFLEENKIRFLPSPGASYQDTGFSFKAWASAQRVWFTDQAFLHYRQDNENSSVNSPGKVFCIAEEFAEIEKFLKKQNLLKDFGELMRVAKWGAYAWNIDRLTAELAADFILLASKEYKADYDKGVFNFELCDVNQSRAINEIIHTPATTIERKHAAQDAKVSVIVPVYNVERYLRRSLNSIVTQTLKDIEIILVDDGSTDGSVDILEEYYTSDVRIKLISQHNSGQSTARNRGIESAHAEYLAFPDSDDYYEPDSLQKLYDAISKNDTDIAMGSLRVVYEDKRYTAIEKNNDKQYYAVKFRGKQLLTNDLIGRIDVSPCNKIFRRSIILERPISFPEGLKYEDAYFLHAYAWSSKTIFFLSPDDYVYNYVRRSGSTMAQTFNGSSSLAYDHIEIAIRLFKFLKKNNLFQQHSDYFVNLFESYFNFSLRHLPQDQHERVFNRARSFIDRNRKYLDEIDPLIWPRLQELVPVVSVAYKIKRKTKNVIKKAFQKVMPRLSLSYRTQRNILDATSGLYNKIDVINNNQSAKFDLLSNKIEDLTTANNK